MKKRYFLALALMLGLSFGAQAQHSLGGTPVSFSKTSTLLPLQGVNVGSPDMNQVALEDGVDEKNGTLRRIARILPTTMNPQNSGQWETLADGSKLWRLKIHSPGALGIFLIYDHFVLPEGSSLFIYNEDWSHVAGAFNSTTNPPASNPEFSTRIIDGDVTILEYHAPVGVVGLPVLDISGVGHIYRDYTSRRQMQQEAELRINESDACQVNVNCSPEGTNWQDEKRGVVRILVVGPSGAGWCSGSLINNTAQDCKRYVLTADHCAGGGGANPSYSTTANLNSWQFYFNYEAPTCTNPSVAGTLDDQVLTGCTKKAQGGNGGDDGSDFYLVEITPTIPANYNVYYNGWSRSTTAATGGVGIHHPSGDIKKISTFTGTLVSDDWNNSGVTGSHWRVVWTATTNGHGVTEGGSSGSPIFNSSGLIIGQLTGGGSFCTATSSPDYYGKMSFNWTSNTVPATGNDLQPFLDPTNSGVTTLNGVYAPCSPQAPVADFSANNTAPCIGSTVTFTDLSSNTPTSWSWSFSPNTVTYVGGTSATSQNPQVQFNAAGNYNVTLVATNAQGNDTETKTAYIVVSSGAALPYSQNFEGATFPPSGITVLNPDAGAVAWGTDGAKGFERRAAAGNTGSASGCAGINYFNYNTSGGPTDALVIKPLSLVGASNPILTFKRAYKYYNNPTYYDELRVYVSTDCGATYGSAVYTKTGTQLATSGTLNTTFTPSVAADWDTDTISLASYVGQNVVIKIEGTSKYGNNLYIDDINIANGPAAVASVSVTGTPNPACSGQSVTFTAVPTNGGTTPTYQWRKNGVNIGGATSSTYTTSAIVNGDQFTCVMTSNLAGVTGSPATSNAVTMTINAVPAQPTISQNGFVLTSSSATGNQWYLNGVIIPGATGQTYTATANGNYTVVVTTSGCSSPASAAANVVGVSIEEFITADLFVVYPNPSSGAFTLMFEVVKSDNYTVEITNSLGQVVYTESLADFTGKYAHAFDVTQHGAGVYFVRLRNSSSESVKKVVVF